MTLLCVYNFTLAAPRVTDTQAVPPQSFATNYINRTSLISSFFLSAGDICSMPESPGPCEAYFPRWFYNSEKGKCEAFVYGGCNENANNFKTSEKCEETCSGKNYKFNHIIIVLFYAAYYKCDTCRYSITQKKVTSTVSSFTCNAIPIFHCSKNLRIRT